MDPIVLAGVMLGTFLFSLLLVVGLAWSAQRVIGAMLEQQRKSMETLAASFTERDRQVLAHLKAVQVVGGQPLDYAERSLIIADERNVLERQRQEIVREEIRHNSRPIHVEG